MRSYDQALGGETQLQRGLYFDFVFLRTLILFSKIQSFEIGSPSFGTFRPS